MQTNLGKLSIAAVTLLYTALFQAAAAQLGASPLLSPRDQTCPAGGVCLSGPGLVCCDSGCMWAGNVCCGDDVFCGPGQFCSTPDNGVVNCCFDEACNTVVYSGGIAIIAYTDQSLYTSDVGAAATTSISPGGPQTTGEATTTTAKTGGTTTNGSPSATKTSAGELTVRVGMAGLMVPLFTVVWMVLGA